MKINKRKLVEVNAKVLKVRLKVSDQFSACLLDQDGEELADYDGYVPDFMPEEHYGDYVWLDIDIDTGQILNWIKPSAEEIEKFCRDAEGEEEP